MTDFLIGAAIGLVAALAVCGAWALRLQQGDPPVYILSGAAVGYVGGIIAVFLVFCFMLAEAFRQ